jgi:putative lipoprotein
MLVGLAAAACHPACAATPKERAVDEVEVRVTWRERMLLPPGARLEVTIEDVARADAPSEVLARIVVDDPPPPPVRVRLPLAGIDLAPARRPVVRARVTVDGRLRFTTDRHYPLPAAPGSMPLEIVLVGVGGRAPSVDGQRPTPDASLTNTYWRLLSIDDRAVAVEAGSREPHLVIADVDGRLGWRGTVGCNRLFGTVEIDGHAIRFPPTGAATLMACPPGLAELERGLAEALDAATRWQISGNRLALIDAGGRTRLVAEAVHLR